MKNFVLLFGAIFSIAACQQKNRPASTAFPDYQIAFNVFENRETDDYEIYVMNADGTGKKNISNWKGVDWVYYAYKNKLYFISDRDTCHRCYFMYEMNADGSDVRKMTDFRVDDSWFASRKNGTEFVVSPRRKENSGFYIIDQNGAIKSRLLNDTLPKNDPIFSPDGKQILFRMKKGLCDELWLMDDDGGNLRQLTHFPPSDTFIRQYGYHAGPLRWNARENLITYQSIIGGNYNLYGITPDGKKQFKLTENNPLEEGWHDWSPDGKWLAIEMFDHDQTSFDIYLMNWKTKKIVRLTDSDKYEQAPVFVEP